MGKESIIGYWNDVVLSMTIGDSNDTYLTLDGEGEEELLTKAVKEGKLSVGDKVKVVIIKEE